MAAWVNKMWSIHIAEYCLVVKRKKVLGRITTWMNLEMLSERSQTQKLTYVVIPFI